MALLKSQCGLTKALIWPYYGPIKARALIGSHDGSIEASIWPY